MDFELGPVAWNSDQYGARVVDSVLTLCCILLTCEGRCMGRGASKSKPKSKATAPNA